MTLTVLDISTRVKSIFGDESGVEIDDPDILRWINDGQLDIARKTRSLTKDLIRSTASGVYEIAKPSDFLFFDRATCDGRYLSPTPFQTLDQLYPTRGTTYPTGRPEYIAVKGNNFVIYPAPDEAGVNNLIINYIASPVAVVANSDTPEINGAFHEALVRFCLMRAKEKDEDWSAAQRIQESYEQMITDARTDHQNPYEGSYPSIRDVGDY